MSTYPPNFLRRAACLAALAAMALLSSAGAQEGARPPATEPGTIPLEPSPLDQPTLFPPESAEMRTHRAERVQRQQIRTEAQEPQSEESPVGTQRRPLEMDTLGAATSFGFDERGSSSRGRTIGGLQAERERERLIARAERQTALEHYNVKLGPIPFRFGAGIEVQITDNVNLSNTNKEADIIATPHFDVYSSIRLSRWNSLSLQFSIGYLWDQNRSDQNRVITNASVGLDTDAGLSLDIKIGNFHINLHERPAIPRQQFDLITQRNPIQYAQFTNLAGISIFWDINSKTSATFQYDHFNSISLQSEVESLDQSAEQFAASASYQVNDSLSLGLQGGASIVKYKQNFLNDATNYNLGLTIGMKLSRNINLRTVIGYQIGNYGSGGATGDTSSVSDWYANLELNHQINTWATQTISIGRESQLGTASNSTEVTYVRHRLGLNIFNHVGFGTTISYDSAVESGGQFAQDFKLFQFGVFSYWSLSRKLTLSLQYRFLKRESTAQLGGQEDLSYTENRCDLALQMAF